MYRKKAPNDSRQWSYVGFHRNLHFLDFGQPRTTVGCCLQGVQNLCKSLFASLFRFNVNLMISRAAVTRGIKVVGCGVKIGQVLWSRVYNDARSWDRIWQSMMAVATAKKWHKERCGKL